MPLRVYGGIFCIEKKRSYLSESNEIVELVLDCPFFSDDIPKRYQLQVM